VFFCVPSLGGGVVTHVQPLIAPTCILRLVFSGMGRGIQLGAS